MDWRDVVVKYQQPSRARALWQLLNTLIPYTAIWCAMYWVAKVSVWPALGLAVLAGAFQVRLFIIFHDCGHGSFFKSREANTVWGFITGVLTFTPYHHWRWEHALHHASSGDLDRRGTGDIWTMTVEEYVKASRGKKFAYRLVRHPLTLLVIAPLFLFFVQQRFASAKAPKRERLSVYGTNVALLLMMALMMWVFGWKTYLLLQVISVLSGGAAGVWLFYVQHQFEGVYWERGEDWDYCTAALKGSSFYKLPKILQWFSGNIGFHHVHHLSPRIPNYHLERCHQNEPLFKVVKPITLLSSLRSLTFRLWDERQQKLVSFGALKRGRFGSA